MLAAVVESSSAEDRVSALLDLIDLRLSDQGSPEGIALLLHAPHPRAAAAIEALEDSIKVDVLVHLMQFDGHGWVPLPASGFDPADAQLHYPRRPGLLDADFTVPAAVTRLVKKVSRREVRADPQLTAKGQ